MVEFLINMPTFLDNLDFKLLFEKAPTMLLVLGVDPHFTILAANDAFLQATLTEREKIIGRGIIDVFPDNPHQPQSHSSKDLLASLNRVVKNKAPDTMAVLEYDIPRPESEGGGFEERHWSPVNSPVFSPEGEVIYIINRSEDITAFILGSKNKEKMELEILSRTQELDQANKKLRQANQELEQFNQAATGRELRLIQLKREINQLSKLLNRPEPYNLSIFDDKT